MGREARGHEVRAIMTQVQAYGRGTRTMTESDCSLHISYWPSFKYLQLLLSPGAAYLPFWHHSLSTFFSYPTSRFQASSSLKITAHSCPLRHVIMSLGPLFWAAFPVLGLSRLRGATSPSAVARTSTPIFPKCSTHFNKPEKSRKIPTQVEVDRVEQSLFQSHADLASN